MTDRAGYISGLRKLADLLESAPEINLPYAGSSPQYGRLTITYLSGKNNKAEFAAAARAFPGKLEKVARVNGYFDLIGNLDGLYIELTAYRDDVCERVVTGVETVTTKVPDPTAPPTPMIEVTSEVETVEWHCGSLLADSR